MTNLVCGCPPSSDGWSSESGITPAQALTNAISPAHPITDLYTLSLHRITLFKSGASFSEHSPLLHSLSQLPSFQKPHLGLQKMFLGEVVGKRVVVQGLWIGEWCCGEDMPNVGKQGGEEARGASTTTPWVSDGRSEVLTRTRGEWGMGTAPSR